MTIKANQFLTPSNPGELSERRNASSLQTPQSSMHEAHTFEHFVQFYESDDFLLDSISNFLGAGLGTGASCLILATQAHREGVEQRLRENGLDLEAAQEQRKYLAVDAAEALARFIVNGQPDLARFSQVVGDVIAGMAPGRQPLHIFGEMVALLWMEGNKEATLQLETLWNDLRPRTSPFLLFCAYPLADFAGEAYAEAFAELCQQHSQVIPGESYISVIDSEERLRMVSHLQQKAVSLGIEIVERRSAEDRLKISENHYRRLFEASTDGILMVEPTTGAISDANPAASKLLGFPREQVMNRELWQVGLLADRQAQDEFLRQLQEQRVLRLECVELSTDSNQVCCVELVSTLFQANGHEVLQCNLRDITERVQAEEALKALEQQREAFIGLVTHELKNPLTALQGNVQLAHRRLTWLLGRTEQLSREEQRTLEDVLTMLSRSQQQLRVEHRLINDLLDVSHIQQNKLELHQDIFDLVGLVYETVQDYQTAQPARLIDLRLPAQDALLVYADRDRLQQVLSNYLTNALKFSPASEPVQVRILVDSGIVRVEVEDHGPGLSPQQQKSIWKRFYQASRTPVQSGWKEGLGLGLYICHQLMSRQGGRVDVESVPGRGATFCFELPLASVSDTPPS